MKSDNRFRAIAIFMTLPAGGCSGSMLKAERVDPPGRQDLGPAGLIEDAATIEQFTLFPDAVDHRIEATLAGTDVTNRKLHEIQSTVCDSKTPRFSPTYKVHLLPPKPQKGIALDRVAKGRKAFIDHAQRFLKGHFFYDAAIQPDLKPGAGQFTKYNYGHFRCYLDSNGGSNSVALRDCHVNIPIVEGSQKGEVEKLLSAIPQGTQQDSRDGAGLVSIVFPATHSIILAQGFVPAYSASWERYYGTTLTTAIGVQGVARQGSGGGSGGYGSGVEHSFFYSPSDYGWKLNETNVVHPLHQTKMADLAVLMNSFTFMLPKKLICELQYPNKVDSTGNYVDCTKGDNETAGTFQHWGYDFNSGNFSPAEAVSDRDFMWDRILSSQTSIKEAAEDDGSIDLEVSLDLGLFCQYGVPLSDLVSK